MLTIEYKYGKQEYTDLASFLRCTHLSAAQVAQALEQSQGELTARLGHYTWTLEGDTYRGYRIVSRDERDQRWVDASGRTPAAALRAICIRAGIAI